ncbi:precorrin-6y C5,15-methyltransferase (decarboxylating) subunit CbiE [Brevirhabdus sp.]|uniref:precorrin-6y C5,15-methyltransferase (decarboxylating) subunit CbiE n=1 Tax=Brevirhabdus sp. TaxID=2004514 RepID=UPI004059B41D
MTPWLHIIGIGEDGWDGLSPAAQSALEAAELIVGGDRHHGLAPHLGAERRRWPSPFRAMVEEIGAERGRRVCVLVTGDPLWYSAGAFFARGFAPEELCYHPHLSAFQLACARMRWSLADVETLTVHGRPAEQVVPFFADGLRLVILTQDATTPAAIAHLLAERGFGPSRMTVLAALGGPNEARIEGVAQDWVAEVPDFHVLAVEVAAAPDARPLPRWGLPDAAFTHDGKMTKRELRTLTLAALAPRRGQRLWDIGAGCGSVAIEWLRADRDMEATGLEPDADRRAMAAANATRLGTPRLRLLDARAPEGLADLPRPDAVFIGGGLSRAVAEAALAALPRHGRLVANAVTLESEALLAELHAAHGGSLIRVAVSRAETIGRYRGWRPQMPVTQWSLMT